AIFPGTFDPITNGHLDIAQRAAGLFDDLIIAVYAHPIKTLLFSTAERLEMAQKAFQGWPNVTVRSYDGLTVDIAREWGARAIIRGLRVVGDFEFEFQMALMNRSLAPEIESVCLMTTKEYYFLSSSIVKEVAKLNGDISELVPPHVVTALMAKIEALGDEAIERIKIITMRD
ncbi:MAG TPA: pantetheine-phosphate adenylyltransferase, partial [Anaerolineae bacterium]|nr:pantetheine-phosphate adenylyltransferase [Anaerolineae bacterium]